MTPAEKKDAHTVQFHERTRVRRGARCGAEHVQKKRVPPAGIPARSAGRLVSFDGDADRIVRRKERSGAWLPPSKLVLKLETFSENASFQRAECATTSIP